MDLDYQIVVQFPIPQGIRHAEDVLSIENELTDAIGSSAEADGHDVLATKANLFVLSTDPAATFEALRTRLAASFPGLPYVAAARKCCDNEDWTILSPTAAAPFSLE